MADLIPKGASYPVETVTGETKPRNVSIEGPSGIDPDVYVATIDGEEGMWVMKHNGKIVGSEVCVLPPVVETSELQIVWHEFCPFRVGDIVTVSPTCKFAEDWPGQYVVTGTVFEPSRSDKINIHIMAPDEISDRIGSTDGFGVDDLVPARQ